MYFTKRTGTFHMAMISLLTVTTTRIKIYKA